MRCEHLHKDAPENAICEECYEDILAKKKTQKPQSEAHKKILELMKDGNPEKFEVYQQGYEKGVIETLYNQQETLRQVLDEIGNSKRITTLRVKEIITKEFGSELVE